ncbi:hypothetical protein IKG45_02680 [Candidatus Saccharibacteria bacterium]|nr:hypothetical protein [Candidatus Saccharibacteria bacterium]
MVDTKKSTAKSKADAKKAPKTTKKVEAKKPADKPAVKAETKKAEKPEVKAEAKKPEEKTKKKSNKVFFIVLAVVLGLVIIGVVVAVCLNSLGNIGNLFGMKKDEIIIENNGKKETLKIVESETKKLEFDKYDNGLVSFEYPKGWTVDVAPADYIHYNFKVYNPEDPDYMFFFGLKFEGYMKSDAARNWQKKNYPSTMFAKLPAIDPQTTERFYKVWNEAVDYSNKEEMGGRKYFNHINNFKVIEKLGNDMVGGDILRATYTNDDGELNQGLFTAAVKSAGSYYVSENIWNLSSRQIDVWPLMIYNIMFMSAPDDDFVNWQSALDKCLGSIEFSDTFVNAFNREESSILTTIQANQKVYDQISDMIMDSWEKRSNSYDIISQKRSDATLGYERVYDTETGDIYKAYNGFTDDYTGDRYQPISDNQYTEAISGYIEK